MGYIDGVAAVLEHEASSMVAAIKDQHLGSVGVNLGSSQSHERGLGAGVGEADELDARETLPDQSGEPGLVRMVAPETESSGQGLLNGLHDDGRGVPIQPRRVFPQEVDVLVAVGVPEPTAVRLVRVQGERVVVQNRPGIASGKRTRSRLVESMAVGVADGKLPGRELLLAMFVHVAHHRGQAEIYLRNNGIVPPQYRI